MRRAKPAVVAAIESQVETMLAEYGFELVEITFGGPKRNPTLTVVIDKAGGVTADDCAEASKRLNVLLDALDPIPTAYQLAVASPGVERPLTKPSDYERFAGREVAVRHLNAADRPVTVTGLLQGIQEGVVTVRVGEEEVRIPEERIESGHLTFSWETYETEAE